MLPPSAPALDLNATWPDGLLVPSPETQRKDNDLTSCIQMIYFDSGKVPHARLSELSHQ